MDERGHLVVRVESAGTRQHPYRGTFKSQGLGPERCAGVAFVERPFFGRPSASILFFNPEGGTMFKIFVGRDEKRELRGDQLAAFRALADRLCTPAAATV